MRTSRAFKEEESVSGNDNSVDEDYDPMQEEECKSEDSEYESTKGSKHSKGELEEEDVEQTKSPLLIRKSTRIKETKHKKRKKTLSLRQLKRKQ